MLSVDMEEGGGTIDPSERLQQWHLRMHAVHDAFGPRPADALKCDVSDMAKMRVVRKREQALDAVGIAGV